MAPKNCPSNVEGSELGPCHMKNGCQNKGDRNLPRVYIYIYIIHIYIYIIHIYILYIYVSTGDFVKHTDFRHGDHQAMSTKQDDPQRTARQCLQRSGSMTNRVVSQFPQRVPSGYVKIAMENPHFSWENPLFLWPFSIAMLNYQRVFHCFPMISCLCYSVTQWQIWFSMDLQNPPFATRIWPPSRVWSRVVDHSPIRDRKSWLFPIVMGNSPSCRVILWYYRSVCGYGSIPMKIQFLGGYSHP